MTECPRLHRIAIAAAAIVFLFGHGLANSQSAGTSATPPKPDLHGGGAKPSEIPNDAVTIVTLPGFHLTGAKIVTGKICKLVSYQVVSDNEIKMNIEGVRTVDDKENQCAIEVRTPAGSASTWIVVDLTDAQQQQVTARENAEGAAKVQAFIQKAGKTWHLAFVGGASETYTSTGADVDNMPTFHNGAGDDVKIAVSDDGTAMIIEPGCMRSGKLTGAQVKNGESQGDCKPSGSWTATVTY